MVPSNTEPKRVRFSVAVVMIIFDDDHTRGIEHKHKMWYSGKDVDKFKKVTTCIVHALRNVLSRCVSTKSSATFYHFLDESVGGFVGLENRLSEEYVIRRQLLISNVMEEHLWQRLRSRVGCSFDDDEAAMIASISHENALSLQEQLRRL
jgi:hypothetical protein